LHRKNTAFYQGSKAHIRIVLINSFNNKRKKTFDTCSSVTEVYYKLYQNRFKWSLC